MNVDVTISLSEKEAKSLMEFLNSELSASDWYEEESPEGVAAKVRDKLEGFW